MKIYTKTGDLGKTSLIGGTKVLKSHPRIDTYGTVDELNAYIGLVRDLCHELLDVNHLAQVQDRLFTIGSSLACDPDKELKMKIPGLYESDITILEDEMDRMNLELPEMRNFILPAGHITISTTHIARCICRRAERSCVHLFELGQFIEPLVIKYLNRLSDYLFVLARYVGLKLAVPDIPWIARN